MDNCMLQGCVKYFADVENCAFVLYFPYNLRTLHIYCCIAEVSVLSLHMQSHFFPFNVNVFTYLLSSVHVTINLPLFFVYSSVCVLHCVFAIPP